VGSLLVESLWTTAARAWDPFEIQVYDGEADAKGAAGLELHLNYVAAGTTSSPPPEAAQNHQAHFTLEPSYGVFDWWEIGAYLQTALRDDTYEYAGVKLRTKFVRPPKDTGDALRLGVNFELSLLPSAYDANRWGTEIRPILGWNHAGWKFIVNPIIDTPLASPGLPLGPTFEPALSAARAIGSTFNVGIEYYGDFGPIAHPTSWRDETQYLFEVFNLLAIENFELNVGFGEGLTAASNPIIVKAIVGYEFDVAGTNSSEQTPKAMLPRRVY
jgi:hypothetical protein